MEMLRFILTADDDTTRQIMDRVERVPGIERVEEVRTLMGGMRDDSSSAGLEAEQEAGTHSIEVQAPGQTAAGQVRDTVERSAHQLDAAVEWVERF